MDIKRKLKYIYNKPASNHNLSIFEQPFDEYSSNISREKSYLSIKTYSYKEICIVEIATKRPKILKYKTQRSNQNAPKTQFSKAPKNQPSKYRSGSTNYVQKPSQQAALQWVNWKIACSLDEQLDQDMDFQQIYQHWREVAQQQHQYFVIDGFPEYEDNISQISTISSKSNQQDQQSIQQGYQMPQPCPKDPQKQQQSDFESSKQCVNYHILKIQDQEFSINKSPDDESKVSIIDQIRNHKISDYSQQSDLQENQSLNQSSLQLYQAQDSSEDLN